MPRRILIVRRALEHVVPDVHIEYLIERNTEGYECLQDVGIIEHFRGR